jgi:hypothetical protein
MSIYIPEPAPDGAEDQQERTLKPLFSEKKGLWGCVRAYPDGTARQIKNSPLCDTEDQAVEWLMGFAEKNGLQVFAAEGGDESSEGVAEGGDESSEGVAESGNESAEEPAAGAVEGPEPAAGVTENTVEPEPESEPELDIEIDPEPESEPESIQPPEFSPAAQHTRAVLTVVSAARKQLEGLAISCSVEKMSIDGDAVTIKFGTSRPENFTAFMNHMKTQIFLAIFPAQGKLPFDIEETAAASLADQQPLTLDGPMPDKPASLREAGGDANTGDPGEAEEEPAA